MTSKLGSPLGVHFDNRLTCDYYISELYKKAYTKISALARVCQYMNLLKRKNLMNDFFDSSVVHLYGCVIIALIRSNLPAVSCKKVPLKISQNSRENTCARVSFLIKLQAAGYRPATLLKKRIWQRCFPVNFVKFLRTPFL